jgi:hypothetical protein
LDSDANDSKQVYWHLVVAISCLKSAKSAGVITAPHEPALSTSSFRAATYALQVVTEGAEAYANIASLTFLERAAQSTVAGAGSDFEQENDKMKAKKNARLVILIFII